MTLRHACQFSDEALAELESLIRAISEQHYQASLSSRSSSIGTHVRHIIEFYQCLFEGLSAELIDYDKRERRRSLESSPDEALLHLKSIRSKLSRLGETGENTEVQIAACTGSDGREINTSSGLVRELLFLQSHTMHHLAVMALLLERTGITIPENLGIATSTRVYRQNLEAEPEASNS